MTAVEQAVKALCEALVRLSGGDVSAYRERVRAMRGLTEDQMLEQVERQIRFHRRRNVKDDAKEGGELDGNHLPERWQGVH